MRRHARSSVGARPRGWRPTAPQPHADLPAPSTPLAHPPFGLFVLVRTGEGGPTTADPDHHACTAERGSGPRLGRRQPLAPGPETFGLSRCERAQTDEIVRPAPRSALIRRLVVLAKQLLGRHASDTEFGSWGSGLNRRTRWGPCCLGGNRVRLSPYRPRWIARWRPTGRHRASISCGFRSGPVPASPRRRPGPGRASRTRAHAVRLRSGRRCHAPTRGGRGAAGCCTLPP